jgi:hypothetical protein
MTHGLAKKLKDAGFPQHQNGHQLDCDNTSEICRPTLSELIEACGDELAELARTTDYDPKGEKAMWRAYMTDEAFDKTGIDCVRECDGYEIGDTPEEAVAKLWLALMKTPRS